MNEKQAEREALTTAAEVAAFIDRKADDYANRFGYGVAGQLSFGSQVKLDHHTSLTELAEEIRALAAPSASAQQAEPVAWHIGNADGSINKIGAVYIRRSLAEKHIESYEGELDAQIVPLYAAPKGASPAALTDEREAAEAAYNSPAFDYERDPVGSRDWRFYSKGWRTRAALAASPAALTDRVQRDIQYILCVLEDVRAAMPLSAAHRITTGKAIEKARAMLAASPADQVSAEVTKDVAPDLTGLTVEADDDDVNGVCVAFLEEEDDTRLDALMDQLLSIPGMPTYLTADYDGWGIVMRFESEAEAHTALEAVQAAVLAASPADQVEPDMLWAYDDPESGPSTTAVDFAETFSSQGMMPGDESVVRVQCAKSMPDRKMLIRVSKDPEAKEWLHWEWIDAAMSASKEPK